MKKILVWLLVLVSLGALLLRFSDKWAEIFLGVKPSSGISVLSLPADAKVALNNETVGKTPYENKSLTPGDYTVKIEKDAFSWQGKVRLSPGTVAVVNRDLAPDEASSAGEILTLQEGKGLTVVSRPSGADVEVDGKAIGKTPAVFDVSSGDHVILLSHGSYLKRSIKVNLPAGYNLTLTVDLALSEPDLTTISTPMVTLTPAVIVKNTVLPNPGFLRVRDKPNLNGKEVGRAKAGDELMLLEETAGWDRVRLSDGTEGFVSSSYIEKKTP